MADLAKLVVSLEAQTGKYQRELQKANKQLTRFANSQEKQFAALARTFQSFGRAFGAAFAGEALRRATKLADEYNQLSTRIKTATRETGDFVKVQQELASISIQTGASFETTIDTFQALSRVRADLGATNDQFLTLTKVVNQLGVIGGASTTAISNGLRQFNQGLAAGVFRAEEFNSIVENLPELAFRIAKGLGVTTGQLRQMVVDGKLLSSDVFRVLLQQAGDIGQQFETIPNNLDRAFNALRVSIGGALSNLDQAVGGTAALAGAIQRVADELAIISGNASPMQILQEQIRDAEDELARLAASGNRFLSSNNPLWKDWADQMNTINDRILTLRGQLKDMRKEAESAATPTSNNVVPLAVPGITPSVTSREVAPGSTIINASDVMTTAIDAQVQAFAEMVSKAKDQEQAFVTLFTDNMVQAADSGFDSILQSWVRTLQQMAARALSSQLFNLLGFGNAGGGFLGIGKLFGGARADGGPVSSGRSYLVGERGPELFTPGASGFVTPNGGGGNVFHIDARGATPGVEQRIKAAIETAVAQADRNRVEAGRR